MSRPTLARTRLGAAGLALLLIVAGCNRDVPPREQAEAAQTPEVQVDGLAEQILGNVQELELVVTIDHARLAAAAGVVMPPSLVTIYSDHEANSALIREDPLIALELPHRVLAYAEPDAPVAKVAYADAAFLMKRHGIEDETLLDGYSRSLERALEGIPDEQRFAVSATGLEKHYGIVQLASDYSFDETIRRLKEAVLAQSDTKWFAEVDFRADAAALGIEIPAVTLLLFGGPGPGGQAMAEFPRLGLDAFCQKLLVYQDGPSAVRVAFNDIAALAQLHYGRSIPIHQGLNRRLTGTFAAAIGAAGE